MAFKKRKNINKTRNKITNRRAKPNKLQLKRNKRRSLKTVALIISFLALVGGSSKLRADSMPAAPSKVARKGSSASTYNQFRKGFSLNSLALVKKIAKDWGIKLQLTRVKVGKYETYSPTFVLAGGKRLSIGGGITLNDTKLSQGTFKRPTGLFGLSYKVPKLKTQIDAKAFNIGHKDSLFATLQMKQGLVKDWLSASAEYINMGMKERDVQLGMQLALNKIVKQPLTLELIKSLKNKHNNYEFSIGGPITIKGHTAIISVGAFRKGGKSKEHVGTLFFALPLK